MCPQSRRIILVVDGRFGGRLRVAEVGKGYVMRKGSRHTAEAKAKMHSAHLGQKHTPEALANMSIAQMGHKVSPEARERMRVSHLGKKPTPETRAKMSAAQLGRKHTPETRARMSAAKMGHLYNLGKKHTPEARARMSLARREYYRKHPSPTGPDHPSWRGGRENYGPGFTEDLRQIVRWLYEDRCVVCGEKPDGLELDVHHVDYDKKNNTIDNLVPLCHSHHSMTGSRRDYWPEYLKRKNVVKGSA